MNAELYQVPTLALLTALVAVFGALWLEGLSQSSPVGQSGDGPTGRRRQMLWLAGWVCAVIRLATQVAGWRKPGWGLVISEGAMELAPLMFLGSLAPQYYSHKPRILYVVAFGLPVMVYCAVIGFDPQPGVVARSVVMACTVLTIAVAARWSLYKHLIPIWLSLVVVALVGGGAAWMTVRGWYWEVGALVHSGVLLMTALLFVAAYRRLTAGLVFTVGGMFLWSLPPLLEPLLRMKGLPPELERALNLVKVMTAVGMIVLVLEEEVAFNQASQRRDRRARVELEKYTALYLAEAPFDEEGGHYNQACETIAEASRFAQAAIFVQSVEGMFPTGGPGRNERGAGGRAGCAGAADDRTSDGGGGEREILYAGGREPDADGSVTADGAGRRAGANELSASLRDGNPDARRTTAGSPAAGGVAASGNAVGGRGCAAAGDAGGAAGGGTGTCRVGAAADAERAAGGTGAAGERSGP